MNKVQFTVEDVVNKFEEIYKLDKRSTASYDIQHTLIGKNIGVTYTVDDFFESEKNAISKPSIHQRVYAKNIENYSRLLTEYVYSIIRTIDVDKSHIKFNRDEVENYARKIINTLTDMQEYLPMKPRILELGEVSEGKKHDIERADFYAEQIYYSYNLKFSPDFKREKYALREDIKEYTEKYSFQDNNETLLLGIRFEPITKQNYLENVIIPLIDNIRDHAYNPNNDIYARNAEYFEKNQKSMSRHVYIDSALDEAHKEIIMSVKDDGFGVSPNIKDKLFTRNASTKTDTTTEHGVGLWVVKNFVEENGGKIWFDTELGQGTTFYFTIPYDRKDIDAYVKD